MTTSFIHPALIMIIGALLLPLVRGPFRKPYLFLVPLLTFCDVLYLSQHPGTYGVVHFLDWELTFGRVDRLSMIFAFIMSLMAIIGTIYGLHVEDEWQHIAAWFYVAGSLGVIYSGDYLVLFLFWEMMAFASTFLIWFNKDPEAWRQAIAIFSSIPLAGLCCCSALSSAIRPPVTSALSCSTMYRHRTLHLADHDRPDAQCRCSSTALLVAGCLQQGHGDRLRLHVRLYHQDGHLYPGQKLCRF